MSSTIRLCVACAVLAACAKTPDFPPARYANAPVILVVNDRQDVPVAPKVRPERRLYRGYNRLFHDRVVRGLEVRRHQRALGVNSVDDVPDSTWFTNRIGIVALTPDQIRTGGLTKESPELHKPWTIESSKIGGTTLGFIIRDARGVKYIMKFDDPGFPEAETGSDVVVARLLWAAGYNVSENHVVYFKPDELVVADTATVKDRLGKFERKLTKPMVMNEIAKLDPNPNGQVRALLSQMIDGKPIGGISDDGVRKDDPNDRIPHARRRDLRGGLTLFAWLDHGDVTSNTLDAWVADPDDPKRHYVKHYFIDFGLSLGGMASSTYEGRRGYTYEVDPGDAFVSLVSLGTRPVPWETYRAPKLRGVWSQWDAASFDPGAWVPDIPYQPLNSADHVDRFWGAKIVAKFTRPQIRAAVEAGRFSDPRAVDYIVDTLVARQRATVAYWFAHVNPLDKFAATKVGTSTALCFDDLAIQNGLAASAWTSYTIALFDKDGKPGMTSLTIPAQTTGHTCTGSLDNLTGYTIARVTTVRAKYRGETYVHLDRSPVTRAPRVIGVYRP